MVEINWDSINEKSDNLNEDGTKKKGTTKKGDTKGKDDKIASTTTGLTDTEQTYKRVETQQFDNPNYTRILTPDGEFKVIDFISGEILKYQDSRFSLNDSLLLMQDNLKYAPKNIEVKPEVDAHFIGEISKIDAQIKKLVTVKEVTEVDDEGNTIITGYEQNFNKKRPEGAKGPHPDQILLDNLNKQRRKLLITFNKFQDIHEFQKNEEIESYVHPTKLESLEDYEARIAEKEKRKKAFDPTTFDSETASQEQIEFMQEIIGAEVDGVWGPNSQKAFNKYEADNKPIEKEVIDKSDIKREGEDISMNIKPVKDTKIKTEVEVDDEEVVEEGDKEKKWWRSSDWDDSETKLSQDELTSLNLQLADVTARIEDAKEAGDTALVEELTKELNPLHNKLKLHWNPNWESLSEHQKRAIDSSGGTFDSETWEYWDSLDEEKQTLMMDEWERFFSADEQFDEDYPRGTIMHTYFMSSNFGGFVRDFDKYYKGEEDKGTTTSGTTTSGEPIIEYHKEDPTKKHFEIYKDNDGNITKKIKYNKQGNVHREFTYKIVDGKSVEASKTIYRKNGEKMGEFIYNDDGSITQIDYNANGLPQKEFTEDKDGKSHGVQKDYDFNGNLEKETNWKDGVQVGKEVKYYENGQILNEVNIKDGKPVGKYTSYYENGQVKSTSNYKNGKKIIDSAYDRDGNQTVTNGTGEWLDYDEDGELYSWFSYKDGKLHGKQIVYENGKISKTSYRLNGKSVTKDEFEKSENKSKGTDKTIKVDY